MAYEPYPIWPLFIPRVILSPINALIVNVDLSTGASSSGKNVVNVQDTTKTAIAVGISGRLDVRGKSPSYYQKALDGARDSNEDQH